MRTSIRTQIIVGFLVLLTLMGVLSYYMISNTRRSLMSSAGSDLMFFAEGVLNDINKHIEYHLEQLQLYARRNYLRNKVKRSNIIFDANSEVESLIKRREDEVRRLKNDTPSPLLKDINNSDFSAQLKTDLMEYLGDIHGHIPFYRITVTNRYGAVVA